MRAYFPKQFLIFLGVFFVLNLLQSGFTELIYDEAYYWYYAQNMAWGYFDHPPMVAALIKLGSLLFEEELGVRFLSTLMNLGTAVMLWLCIDHKQKKEHIPLFYLLLFSMPLLNAYGFFTLPDTPLLFFTSVFLYLYKLFLRKNSILLAVLLGITMAAMMYSKYHAALIIVFVFLSNIKLLTNKQAWLAVLVGVLCYLPHLNWLYENDFVTLQFHFSERPNQPYNFEGFTLGYLLNLVVIFGLIFPWVYWALLKVKLNDKFTRALVFLTYGFILFFFISSFNRRTQAQWLITICIPLALITYRFLLHHKSARKWFVRFGVASVLILLYARAWLIYQPLFPKIYETHGNRAWAERIEKEVGSIPVVFENTYRRPSMYQFYSGNPSFALNNIFYRLNQYSIDNSEQKVQGKRVAYLSKFYPPKDFTLKYKDSSIFNGTYFDDFTSYRKLRCYLGSEELDLSKETHEIKVYNPYSEKIPLQNLSFVIGYLNEYKQLKETLPLKIQSEKEVEILSAKDSTRILFKIPKPKKGQWSYARFGINENDTYPGINSQTYSLYGTDR